MLQSLVDLLVGKAGGCLQMEYDAGVDVSGAGAHYQPFHGGQAHAVIDALAVADGCDAAAVTQVSSDQIQLFQWLTNHPGGAASYVLMRSSVEAVAADAMFLIPLVG